MTPPLKWAQKPKEKNYLHISEESGSQREALANTLERIGTKQIDIFKSSEPSKKYIFPAAARKIHLLINHTEIDHQNQFKVAKIIHFIEDHYQQVMFRNFLTIGEGRVGSSRVLNTLSKNVYKISGDLKRMDKDGTLDISFDEWRDYLLFHPSANLHDIIMYWRHATTLDLGEDLAVPDDFSLEEWLSGKWWRHLMAGGVAGAVSRSCTAPLDRLKIFLQVYGQDKTANRRSIPEVLKYMLKEGGLKGLWRGNGINVLKIAPETAIKFAAYEKAKKLIKGDKDREVHIYERLLAGSTAGAVSQTTIYPMEVLKTRLALRKTGQYKSIADCAVQIFKREGFRPFYRGYIPNIMGIIPYAGIDLAVYETLKRYYIKRTTEEGVAPGNSPVLVTVCCGAFSSTCGQIASYPLALVRTRLQAQVIAPGVKQYHPTTMTSLFKHIVATEGFKGLYRGITPNFMKVIPAVSISYVVYEKCRQMLGVGMT
ncbi:unnamed protein product, partial [Meganyctiphanes norvegica]